MILRTATIDDRRVLVLDSKCLRDLGVTDEETFEVVRRGDHIELLPLPADRASHVRDLAEQVMSAHDETFRKLSQ